MFIYSFLTLSIYPTDLARHGGTGVDKRKPLSKSGAVDLSFPSPATSRRCVSGWRPSAVTKKHGKSECFGCLNFILLLNHNCLSYFSLLPSTRRPHRGPRPGPKKSKSKQSALRREALLGRGVPDENGVIHQALPTERSKDMRTAEQIRGLIPWVRG